jgi:hypothetical protein
MHAVRLSLLLSLLTGCAPKATEQIPTAPGVSLTLTYPVVLVGQGRLVVRPREPDNNDRRQWFKFPGVHSR